MPPEAKSTLLRIGLPPRAEMVFTGFDWHEEISSSVDGPHPLSVNSEDASAIDGPSRIEIYEVCASKCRGIPTAGSLAPAQEEFS